MNHIPANEEEYSKLLERIIKGAEFLEHPLINDNDYERGMKKYDRLCEEARMYRESNAG